MKGGAPEARRWLVDGTLLVLALVALCVAVMVSAWVCDDALITSRTIDQLLHGRGLRFNPAERVQAFTHPLWLFVVTPFQAATGEALWASVLPSLTCTAGAVFCVLRAVGPGARAGWVAAGVLVSSKAFVDYSTSGLENPLTHLLLAAFAWRVLATGALDARRIAEASAIAALLFTTRMDAALMIAPLTMRLAHEAWRGGAFGSRVKTALWAASPALLWLAFAWLYFGQVQPNTAQAKLATGIDRGVLVEQGLRYLRVFADLDPAGVMALASGLIVGATASRDARMRAWSAGAVLYLAYVVWIGGDFMAGRFLSGPVLMAAIALGRAAGAAGTGPVSDPAPHPDSPRAPDWSSRYAPLAAVLCIALSLGSPASPLRASTDDAHTAEGASQAVDVLPAHGVVDERLWYYARTGLLSSHRDGGLEPESACRPSRGEDAGGEVRVRRVCGGLGRVAFEGCRDDHWIDPCGLTDAFLAARPVAQDTGWRIGHFARTVPPGYGRSVAAGRALMRDPALDAAFERTQLRVRAPLFDRQRLRLILAHPFGGAPSEVAASPAAPPVEQ